MPVPVWPSTRGLSNGHRVQLFIRSPVTTMVVSQASRKRTDSTRRFRCSLPAIRGLCQHRHHHGHHPCEVRILFPERRRIYYKHNARIPKTPACHWTRRLQGVPQELSFAGKRRSRTQGRNVLTTELQQGACKLLYCIARHWSGYLHFRRHNPLRRN